MNGELIIKPTIQHFRLVEETEKKIRAFTDSFINSIILTPKELAEEEKTRWIYFSTNGFNKDSLPKEIVEKLCLKEYKNNRVYIIYPSLVPDFGDYNWHENNLVDIEWIMRDLRLFKKDTNRKRILNWIDKKVIIPIRKADYRQDNNYYSSSICRFKQGDYIKKYELSLDYYEEMFKEDIEVLKNRVRDIFAKNFGYYDSKGLRYVVNKYGQPLPVFSEPNREATKMYVDRKKECINLITDINWCRCIISVDIKTNSIVRIGRKLKRDMCDDRW